MDNYETIRRIISSKKITDKKECYLLYEAGVFGNKALTWKSYQEIVDSGWKGMVCMRSRKGVDRKRVDYNIKLSEVPEVIKSWNRDGFSEETIAFNQSMPDDFLRIQGEVAIFQGIYHLLYTREKVPMNKALDLSSHEVSGLTAKILLQSSLNPSSYADLEALFEMFPDSAIEFSSYEINVGDTPGRNTVFWEVRNY